MAEEKQDIQKKDKLKSTITFDEQTEEKEARAIAKMIRISARKVRLVIDLIRGKSIEESLAILQYTPKAASPVVTKLLLSAVANAEHNYDMDIDNLYVAEVYANEGATLKRFRPRAQGRASAIHKRTSHITIVVKEMNGR